MIIPNVIIFKHQYQNFTIYILKKISYFNNEYLFKTRSLASKVMTKHLLLLSVFMLTIILSNCAYSPTLATYFSCLSAVSY